MLDYMKRFLIAGMIGICVSLLFIGGTAQSDYSDTKEAAELANNQNPTE